MIVVFGGLPGTGKTTISKKLATRLQATYLRIDAIEQAIRGALATTDVGAAGYGVALALAEANLGLGTPVVADCVNPVMASRIGWRRLADRMNTRLIEVEIICSDPLEHRRRVEGRAADIPGHIMPSWASVLAHVYEPWDVPHIVVDTAIMSETSALDLVLNAVETKPAEEPG